MLEFYNNIDTGAIYQHTVDSVFFRRQKKCRYYSAFSGIGAVHLILPFTPILQPYRQAFKVPIIFYPKKIQKVPLPYQTVLNNLMVHHNLCWYRYPVPT